MAILPLAIFFLLFPTFICAQSVTGKVIGILDPQTLHIRDATRGDHWIRLGGIIGPPSRHPLREKAKKNLESLVFGRTVTVEWDRQEGNCIGRVEAFRCRKVGKVFLDVTTDVGLELIARGMAKHDRAHREFQSTPDRTQYAETEERARLRRLGVWGVKSTPTRQPSVISKKKKRAGQKKRK